MSMARLHLGGRDTARVHMYGTMNMDTVNFIQNRIDNITNLYGEGAAWFQDKLQQRFNDSAIRSINIAQNNMRYSGGVFDDGIHQMFSIDDFRTASRNNQRYVLSNPYFQKEYSSGRIEGWGFEEDRFPKLTGEDNPYYQQVVDGMVQYADENYDGEEHDEKFVIYSNDALDELPELLMNQKVMVRNNWNRFYGMISEGEEDPSSLHGAYL